MSIISSAAENTSEISVNRGLYGGDLGKIVTAGSFIALS